MAMGMSLGGSRAMSAPMSSVDRLILIGSDVLHLEFPGPNQSKERASRMISHPRFWASSRGCLVCSGRLGPSC